MAKEVKIGLIDGMNVLAVISLEKATVPDVPNDAIVTGEGKDYTFVLTDAYADSVKHKEGKYSIKHDATEQHGAEEKENNI